jgi:hypothetical protein
MYRLFMSAVAALGLVLASVLSARADLAPRGDAGDGTLYFVGAGLIVVVVLWLLIRGALSLSGKEDADEEAGGVGVLEGIDEDDDERRKKR